MNPQRSFLFALLLTVTVPLFALGQSPATQFGHQLGWTSEGNLSPSTNFERAWQVTVGAGRSQIIADNDRLFVFSGESKKRKEKPPLVKTRLTCLDRTTGNEIWKRESDSQDRLKGQESFSGATLSPRATPTILNENILSVSYTGILECVDSETGALRWKKELSELGATAVQFGFSSSPVGNGVDTDRFYLTAAGPDGGLYCLATADGSTIWKSPCTSFSYATPVFAAFAGVRQILVVSRNEILGVAESDGKQLWRHELKEQGLTNVPSPIALQDGFIHSSQGSKGTSRVDVALVDGSWETKERWYTRKVKFFYSNWALLNSETLFGVADGFLVVLNTNDGSIAGKWRGFADGNFGRVGDVILLVDGKGTLNVLNSKLNSDEPRLEVSQAIGVLKARCWTPPTILPEGILLRGGTELTLLKFSGSGERGDQALENRLKEVKTLRLARP